MRENETREDVEAVPGPAFEITKEIYDKIQKSNNPYKEENDEFLKRVNNVKMNTEEEEN